ncbi:MAG TPA: tetratricopeptide repeat protein, partial [Geobacteraceae bacterium]
EGLTYAFTFAAGNWHPLTWLSHMLDVELFGLDPRGHHGVNLLLHTATTLLLCLFLLKTTGKPWRSLTVALLFSLHPLHVESVAWVAERKDLLCAFFWFATLLAYERYVRSPAVGRYLVVLVSFALALLSKPMAVTLPLVLFLVDYWPLDRRGVDAPSRRRIVTEKLPLLVLSAASTVVTWFAQQTLGNVVASSPLLSAGNAVISYLRYLARMVYPRDLAIIYPFDASLVTLPKVVGSLLVLVALSWCVWRWRRRFPFLVTGWLWYLVTLLPVIGFVRIGYHAMADRYTYLPLVGVFMALVWGGAHVAERFRRVRLPLAVATGLALSLLAFLTVGQLRLWRDSVTLFSHTVAVTKDNFIAHNNLGTALREREEYAAAIYHYRESARLRPDIPNAFNNLGSIYIIMGYPAEALAWCDRALRVGPAIAEVHYNRALALIALGRRDEALAEYGEVKRLNAGLAERLEEDLSQGGRR